jgi:phage baseplate assembly protein W
VKPPDLGRGLRFPVSLNPSGAVSSAASHDHVRQSLFVLLGTAPGERVGRPDFGCRIHDLMFAPNSALTAARAEVYCEEAIARHEPRVARLSVHAAAHPDEPNRLDIRIRYELVGEVDARELTYPLHLHDERPEPGTP